MILFCSTPKDHYRIKRGPLGFVGLDPNTRLFPSRLVLREYRHGTAPNPYFPFWVLPLNALFCLYSPLHLRTPFACQRRSRQRYQRDKKEQPNRYNGFHRLSYSTGYALVDAAKVIGLGKTAKGERSEGDSSSLRFRSAYLKPSVPTLIGLQALATIGHCVFTQLEVTKIFTPKTAI